MTHERRIRRAWTDAELLDMRIRWEDRGTMEVIRFDREIGRELQLAPGTVRAKRQSMGLTSPRKASSGS